MVSRLVEKARKQPLLQIALDFINIEEAIKVGIEVAKAGAHIIEIGTPLVKTYGFLALEKIRSIADKSMVIADLKTVDATQLEFSAYIEKGIDGVTMLGIVDDEIVQEAVSICREAGVALIADTIYIPNPVDRALKLADIGVDIVALHLGVDVQKKRGLTAKELLREVSEVASSGVLTMVAGGIKPQEVKLFASHGAKIIVIGSAITRSLNPYQATIDALKNLEQI